MTSWVCVRVTPCDEWEQCAIVDRWGCLCKHCVRALRPEQQRCTSTARSPETRTTATTLHNIAQISWSAADCDPLFELPSTTHRPSWTWSLYLQSRFLRIEFGTILPWLKKYKTCISRKQSNVDILSTSCFQRTCSSDSVLTQLASKRSSPQHDAVPSLQSCRHCDWNTENQHLILMVYCQAFIACDLQDF